MNKAGKMKRVYLHKMSEVILSTGIMAFIMSGAMSAFNMGLSMQMLSSWASTYPFSWLLAIPSILFTKKVVSMIMTFSQKVEYAK